MLSLIHVYVSLIHFSILVAHLPADVYRDECCSHSGWDDFHPRPAPSSPIHPDWRIQGTVCPHGLFVGSLSQLSWLNVCIAYSDVVLNKRKWKPVASTVLAISTLSVHYKKCTAINCNPHHIEG